MEATQQGQTSNSSASQQSSTINANKSYIKNQLDQAFKLQEAKNLDKSLEIYTELIEKALKDPTLMQKTEIEQILSFAEYLKNTIKQRDLENRNESCQEQLLLNIPGGIKVLENSVKKEIAVAFCVDAVSNFVLINTSCTQTSKICINNCYVLKKIDKNNPTKVFYGFFDKITNKKTTFEVDTTLVASNYLHSIDTLIQSSAVEFKDTSEVIANVVENKSILVQEPGAIIVPKKQESDLTNTDKVSSGIIKTSEFLDKHLTTLSSKTKDSISNYSTNFVATTKPNETPTAVNENLQKTLKYGSTAAKYTAKGVGAVAGFVGKGCQIVAGQVTDYIETNYVTSTQNEDGTTKTTKPKETNYDIAYKLGGASLAAIGTIWNSLEENLTDVARTTRTETVKIVNHKHGSDAAYATNKACGIAIDGTKTFFYVDSLGIKAIAKNTAKKTGKQFVKSQAGKRAVN